jgi:lipopolysaccharide transport system ATP-binding protein
MQPILEIKNVSKEFVISHERKPYLSFGEKISSIFKGGRDSREKFLALNDVSFNVEQGDTIGLIGKNGAGKSTLLKILSRITPPSNGEIISRGRIASLLEVGTGFHPELSGRDNIFLNGSILGMKKKEIQEKFDEIVDFSGVERFLDTPLKRYSSGMQLRLAFAVAAFLEPEILIIDEVLAVGDMEFQKKCIQKMENVSRSGRTIIFVSHNMAAVKKLCTKGILLNGGEVKYIGNIKEAINRYTEKFESYETDFDIPVRVADDAPGYAYKIIVEDLDGKPANNFPVGAGWRLRLKVKITHKVKGFIAGIGMLTQEDEGLRTCWSDSYDLDEGEYEFIFSERNIYLASGSYKLILGLSARMVTFQYLENCATLRIAEEIAESAGNIKFAKDVGIILNPMEIVMSKM